MTSLHDDYAHLNSSDNHYIDSLYEQFKNDPSSVDESWSQFFKGFEFRKSYDNLEARSESKVTQTSQEVKASFSEKIQGSDFQKELNVFRIIQSFRNRGHLLSDTNPIKERIDRNAMIELEHYGLDKSDWEKEFLCGNFLGLEKPTLKNIWDHMYRTYCGAIGIEYTHSSNTLIRRWARDKFEREIGNINYPIEKKKRILQKMNEANIFETFLQAKFIGQKRFSLEGGESAIVAMDAAIERGAALGVEEFVVGMAHRGRLNMLANTFGKTYEFIFKEFESVVDEHHEGGGDVKYHLGFSSQAQTQTGHEVKLKLMHNPSHLEAVAPVTNGYARAQADLFYQGDYSKIVPIIIHGDAAVAGQGIVYENLQMSELDAYKTGGSIHFVINNQIGFTTDFTDGRSSHYSTSIARTLDAPIIHVNGDDPEAVTMAMEFAIDFRQKFQKDIFVDMVCYRKHGHNEGDEPKYTQPHLYGLVKKHKNPREIYLAKLLQMGAIEKSLAEKMQNEFKQKLSDRFNNVKQNGLPPVKQETDIEWENLRKSRIGDFDVSPNTSVSKEKLDKIIEAITTYPQNFNIIRKAKKLIDGRAKKYADSQLDWALCELLAYGSLLLEDKNIRFTGQDVIRGTFSHRHSKLVDENTNEYYCGLNTLNPSKANMSIYNSLLSEYAVVGFEYGHSIANPNGVNIWEAQFGDFANTAQVMFDQFISSGETKWEKMSDLIMLLPHGYEGQGPEHSSARMERFLQLTGEDNMIVANCTTPANMFHILRRQQAFEFRKPLVVFTPKSLLREPRCISMVEDLTEGRFQEVIDDPNADAMKVKRIIFSTGRVYYDLLKRKEELERDDVALVRMEQLYPFPQKQFAQIIKKYKGAQLYWVQEEPENMGAWSYLISRHTRVFSHFKVVSRGIKASPATGFMSQHLSQQEKLLTQAFSIND